MKFDFRRDMATAAVRLQIKPLWQSFLLVVMGSGEYNLDND